MDSSKISSPKVWSKFSWKNDESIKFRIQDLPYNRLEDALDFLMAHYITEETLGRASGISKNQEAIKQSRQATKEWLKKPEASAVICCLDSDSVNYEIIGISMMCATTYDEMYADLQKEMFLAKTKEYKKFFEVLRGMYSMADTLRMYGPIQFWDGRGMAIHPDFRSHGIAKEFCKVRRMICKDSGIPMTVAWMTSPRTQKAAEQDGWQKVFEISYNDLENQYGISFGGSSWGSFMLMVFREQ